MSDKEEQLRQIIHSGPLIEFNFYQVNEAFFELPEEGYWLIDGIELKFTAGTISAVWNSKFDCYELNNDVLSNIYTQDNLFHLETENIKKLNTFIGLKVNEVNFKTKEFKFILDYTMRTESEKRFVELILEFQNKQKIQIAFVNYSVEDNEAPTNFSFDINTSVLLSTKKIIQIKN